MFGIFSFALGFVFTKKWDTHLSERRVATYRMAIAQGLCSWP